MPQMYAQHRRHPDVVVLFINGVSSCIREHAMMSPLLHLSTAPTSPLLHLSMMSPLPHFSTCAQVFSNLFNQLRGIPTPASPRMHMSAYYMMNGTRDELTFDVKLEDLPPPAQHESVLEIIFYWLPERCGMYGGEC